MHHKKSIYDKSKSVQKSLNLFSLNKKLINICINACTSQCFQIPLAPRMIPVWDFVVGIFAQKAQLNIDI